MTFVNAAELLNAALANKPFILKSGSREFKERVCYPSQPIFSIRPFGPMHDGEWPPLRATCKDEIRHEAFTYTDYARVTSTEIIAASSPAFGAVGLTGIPERVRIETEEFENPGNVAISHNSSLQLSAQESFTIRLLHSVTTTKTHRISVSGGIKDIGSASASADYAIAISNSEETSSVKGQTIVRSTSTTYQIPPRTYTKIELLAFESSARIPFTMTAILDGDLEPNVSSLSRASQILSEAERTFLIEGYVDVSTLSHSKVRVKNRPMSDDENPNPSSYRAVFYNAEYFASEALLEFIAKEFVELSALNCDENYHVQLQDDPTIGPPDGIHHRLLYSSLVYEPSPACGFNDLGVMNMAEFNLEAREYSEYAGGKLVRQWQEEVRTFSRCVNP